MRIVILYTFAAVVGGLLFGFGGAAAIATDRDPQPWVKPAAAIAGAVASTILLSIYLRASKNE